MYQKYMDYVRDYLLSHNGDKSPNKGQGFRSRASHCERVYRLVRELSIDIKDIHKDSLYIAAIFHDIGYCFDIDNNKHAERSAEIFKKYAVSNNLDKKLSNEIFKLINLHSDKELLKNDTISKELVILMEADLLDEEGAMGIVFDCMTEGALNPSCYEDSYYHMKKYSAAILNSYPMITDKAKEYWSKKQKVVSNFMELLKMELNINDKGN